MTCKKCKERGKTWNGSDPSCAFGKDGVFGDNWNCATVNLIRNICDDQYGTKKLPYGISVIRCNDQSYATINLGEMDDTGAYALWVTWYKNRGRTEAMWILDSDEPPRKPTEDELLEIYAHYSDCPHPIQDKSDQQIAP